MSYFFLKLLPISMCVLLTLILSKYIQHLLYHLTLLNVLSLDFFLTVFTLCFKLTFREEFIINTLFAIDMLTRICLVGSKLFLIEKTEAVYTTIFEDDSKFFGQLSFVDCLLIEIERPHEFYTFFILISFKFIEAYKSLKKNTEKFRFYVLLTYLLC